ncbi:glycosyltransferase family 1 protein [Blastococcus brunescens]|uniref:Glycosyltransferase family 1 protein n=1 Tax=Blastococcus brunescens TaxID=1564165 RepID=A0ABZ1AXP0_9ACTN|nr:glycosyltransferase family 1 protein [Blastococcus sp. BMG 8361]WRL62897.1 glycosyltransferase family 1 protein [Blastococcus sp. BMG 8361]
MAEGADLAVVVQAHDVAHYRDLVPGVDLLAAPAAAARPPVRFAWEQAGLPGLVRRSGADVLHSPHYTMPLAVGVPVVTTLHDATFFTHPDVHLAVKRTFFRSWTRVSLRRARRCVTPSAATRDELVRVAGARADRIDVAHLGVDSRRFHVPSDAERAAVREHLGLTGRYVAFLGTLEPRKNAAALVRGWVRAVADAEDPPALVLAGGRGWDEEIERAAAEVPAGLTLLRPGYLPLEQLAGLLGGAEVVAYPSLGEGFGLPVLEAMACGAPVLTTRRLSLPEVGGDAVAYTEPDPGAIGTALRELLDAPERRAALAAAARDRAALFDWRSCARAHLRSYASAAGL